MTIAEPDRVPDGVEVRPGAQGTGPSRAAEGKATAIGSTEFGPDLVIGPPDGVGPDYRGVVIQQGSLPVARATGRHRHRREGNPARTKAGDSRLLEALSTASKHPRPLADGCPTTTAVTVALTTVLTPAPTMTAPTMTAPTMTAPRMTAPTMTAPRMTNGAVTTRAVLTRAVLTRAVLTRAVLTRAVMDGDGDDGDGDELADSDEVDTPRIAPGGSAIARGDGWPSCGCRSRSATRGSTQAGAVCSCCCWSRRWRPSPPPSGYGGTARNPGP